jgi:hypothetical protein
MMGWIIGIAAFLAFDTLAYLVWRWLLSRAEEASE